MSEFKCIYCGKPFIGNMTCPAHVGYCETEGQKIWESITPEKHLPEWGKVTDEIKVMRALVQCYKHITATDPMHMPLEKIVPLFMDNLNRVGGYPNIVKELHALAQAVHQSRAIPHGDRIAYASLPPALERAVARAQNVFERYGLRLMTDKEIAAITGYLHQHEKPKES